MSDKYEEYTSEVKERIEAGLRQSGSIGLVMGILVAREISERSDVDPDIVEILNEESYIAFLQKVASGEVILQDQVVSGESFNPQIEEKFQRYAQEFMGRYDETKSEHQA